MSPISVDGNSRVLGVCGYSIRKFGGRGGSSTDRLMHLFTKMTNKMLLCRIIYYSLAALHVSRDIFAHDQEHINCITASGVPYVCCCWLVSWESWNYSLDIV